MGVSLLLFGCAKETITGEAADAAAKKIRANSCDKDDTCEVNQRIYAHEGLVINPNFRSTQVLGELQVVNELNKPVERIKISDHSIESLRTDTPLRLSSGMGYVELDHSARISNLFMDQNRIVSDKKGEPLVLSSDSKTVKVEYHLETTGNVIARYDVMSDNHVKAGKNVYAGGFVESNGLTLNNLVGKGSAYACVNSKGQLFRSDTPCR